MAEIMLHAGGRLVTLDDVKAASKNTPAATKSWKPVPHIDVYEAVKANLAAAGYYVRDEKLALARAGDTRFFGVLDLTTPLAGGVALSVGVRNSVDKSFPIGFAAGSRVFVCDNLAFRSELMVKRKHTTNGMHRFKDDIVTAIGSLGAFKDDEARRIEFMATREITDEQASHLIVLAVGKDIINAQEVLKVFTEYHDPKHDDFKPRTLWSLFNAFTDVLRPKFATNPERFSSRTIRLNGLILPPDTPRMVCTTTADRDTAA